MIERPTQPQDEDIGEDDAKGQAREGGRVAVGQREDFDVPLVETQDARVEIRAPPLGLPPASTNGRSLYYFEVLAVSCTPVFWV